MTNNDPNDAAEAQARPPPPVVMNEDLIRRIAIEAATAAAEAAVQHLTPGFACAATPGRGDSPGMPLYMQTTPKKSTGIINLFGNYSDMDLAEQKKAFKAAVKMDDDFEKLELVVGNSKEIMSKLKDLAIHFHWWKYLQMPTAGSGAIDGANKASPTGKTRVMNIDFQDLGRIQRPR